MLKLLTKQWQRGTVWSTCQIFAVTLALFIFMVVVGLKVNEIQLGKKLGFAGNLGPARNVCTIRLVILKSCLWGMSRHHSCSFSCCNSWGQPSCSGSHICGSKGMSIIPICKCGEVAVVRVARTSKKNGRQFWGCSKYKSVASNNMVWCNYFKWCDEELYDDRDGIIAQQRMKISELEISVRVMKKMIQFFLELVIVIIVIFIVMVPVMLKNQCV